MPYHQHWKISIALVLIFSVNLCKAQLPNTISAQDKVYGLSKFWQEVNYNFVYLEQVDRRMWDSVYRSYITQVQATRNDYEYYRILQRFCALLKDGHTNIFEPNSLSGLMLGKMFGKYWFNLDYIEGKAVVTRHLKSIANEIPIGTEIIAVNGIPTEKYARDSIEPYISSSTEHVRKKLAIQNLFYSPIGTSYDVVFKKPDGTQFPLHLTHERTTDTSLFPAQVARPLFELKWYPEQTAYLALNSFDSPAIDSIFLTRLPELYHAKALIIDLRNNGGGNTDVGTFILKYFIKDSIMQHARNITREHKATYKAWGKFVSPKDTAGNELNNRYLLNYLDKYYYSFDYSPDTVRVDGRRIVVPTAILVSTNTASAAEDFLISADDQPHMKRIGERSFGSTGQPFIFEVIKGITARVCTKKDTYPDGRLFVGVGVVPHIQVVTTVSDFMRQADPVLQKALEYLRGQQR